MNPIPHQKSSSNVSVFLLGTVINILPFAAWASLADYTIKAIIGGIIWLIFKLISDYLSLKLFSKKDVLENLDSDDEARK